MPQSSKAKPQPRDKWLHIKVSLDEREHLKLLAHAQGSTVADLVRASISHRVTGMKPKGRARITKAADPALLAALARIGNNLNQVGRWVNRHRGAADAVQVLASLAAIERELKLLLPYQQSDENKEEVDDDVGSII